MQDLDLNNPAIKEAYRRGMIVGVTRFAHWSNGVQLVGTNGHRLNDAVDDINKDMGHVEPDSRRFIRSAK